MRLTKKIGIVGVSAAFVMAGGAAFAGTSYANYNTTVAPYNGSGYTGYQTKAITGAAGYLDSESVGGSYKVDARMEGASDGDWARDITDGSFRYLYNQSSAGASVRVQFSNDWNTPVHVQVTGRWKSQ